jgi:hypothetical protein
MGRSPILAGDAGFVTRAATEAPQLCQAIETDRPALALTSSAATISGIWHTTTRLDRLRDGGYDELPPWLVDDCE